MSDGEVRPFLGKGFKISFKNLLTYHQNASFDEIRKYESFSIYNLYLNINSCQRICQQQNR